MSTLAQLESQYAHLGPLLNERQRRLWAAATALALGRGGITRVATATGLSRMTVRAGIRELQNPDPSRDGLARQRRPGGGRKPLTEEDPALLRDLEALVEPLTRGDADAPLRWTCKSLRQLARDLGARGRRVAPDTVASLLRHLGYRLQPNRGARAEADRPDRSARFESVNALTRAFQGRGQPVVSVGVHAQGPAPVPTRSPLPAGPGADRAPAAAAAEALRRWWQQAGRQAYPGATELLLHADGAGGDGGLGPAGRRALAGATGLQVTVCQLPPGTSKWTAVEHRFFYHVSLKGGGRHPPDHEVVISVIGNPAAARGRAAAPPDRRRHPPGGG
jgi:hypothetical protein